MDDVSEMLAQALRGQRTAERGAPAAPAYRPILQPFTGARPGQPSQADEWDDERVAFELAYARKVGDTDRVTTLEQLLERRNRDMADATYRTQFGSQARIGPPR